MAIIHNIIASKKYTLNKPLVLRVRFRGIEPALARTVPFKVSDKAL